MNSMLENTPRLVRSLTSDRGEYQVRAFGTLRSYLSVAGLDSVRMFGVHHSRRRRASNWNEG